MTISMTGMKVRCSRGVNMVERLPDLRWEGTLREKLQGHERCMDAQWSLGHRSAPKLPRLRREDMSPVQAVQAVQTDGDRGGTLVDPRSDEPNRLYEERGHGSGSTDQGE